MDSTNSSKETPERYSMFDQLTWDWNALLSGTGSIQQYISRLDNFLIFLVAADYVNEMVTNHLNAVFLQLMYPNGEHSSKRDILTLTFEEILDKKLDPPNIAITLWSEAIRKMYEVRDAVMGLSWEIIPKKH